MVEEIYKRDWLKRERETVDIMCNLLHSQNTEHCVGLRCYCCDVSIENVELCAVITGIQATWHMSTLANLIPSFPPTLCTKELWNDEEKI